MPALELISGQVTAPSTTETALTMAAGNSLTVRWFPEGANAYLLTLWEDVQATGIFSVRSPKMHDNVKGFRARTVVSNLMPNMPPSKGQKLYAQDTLIATLSGSATAGDIEGACMLFYYDNLPGSNGRFDTWNALKDKIKNIVTVENTISTGTSGGYSGEEAINAEQDLFKANTDYALLGYLCQVEASAVRIRGTDTGNLGVGGPGDPDLNWLQKEWFIWLSVNSGLPTIPIFNSANKSGILVDALQDENGADPVVNWIFGEL